MPLIFFDDFKSVGFKEFYLIPKVINKPDALH